MPSPEQDLDLGSAAPALLPPIPGSRAKYLAIQAGKEGVLRLLNRENLSGQGGPGHVGGELQTIDAPNHCPVLTQPAVWTDPHGGVVWAFVASGCALGGYRVNVSKGGAPTLQLVWTAPLGATSPVVAGGVVFAATTGAKAILALDPRTGPCALDERESAVERHDRVRSLGESHCGEWPALLHRREWRPRRLRHLISNRAQSLENPPRTSQSVRAVRRQFTAARVFSNKTPRLDLIPLQAGNARRLTSETRSPSPSPSCCSRLNSNYSRFPTSSPSWFR